MASFTLPGSSALAGDIRAAPYGIGDCAADGDLFTPDCAFPGVFPLPDTALEKMGQENKRGEAAVMVRSDRWRNCLSRR